MQSRVMRTPTGCLVVIAPPGRWEVSDAEAAINMMELLVDPAGRYVFVADVAAMTGYDPTVRKMWQGWLGRRRRQITDIWIVGAKIHPIVRLGIATASAALSRHFHFARTLRDVPGMSAVDAHLGQ
jgi:hypothetical protein